MKVANFLLSPKAQLRKADSDIWGDPTVLDMEALPDKFRQKFSELPRGVATLAESDLGKTIAEPHPSWVGVIESAWVRRYGVQ